MLTTLRTFIVTYPILAASLSSLWGAIVVDLLAFTKARSLAEFEMSWSAKVAGFRYAQALVSGFIGNVAIAGAASVLTVALVYWLR